MVKATLNFIWRYPTMALLAFSCFGVAATASPTHGAESINGIAAIVNDKVITYSEVRDVVEPRERLLRSQYSGPELAKKITELRKAALQDLIDRQLIIQSFEKDKLQIPPHFVDERVDQVIKESFGGDRRAFLKTMEAQKYTMSKFRDLERDKIIVSAMRSKNVTSNLIIPPGKVEEYYRTHKELFSSKAQVKLRMIMIPGHTESGGGVAQTSMADEIRSKLITGADFDKMAQMYSEDSTRDLGGDWGWIDDKTLAPELSRIAFSLKPGEISKVVDIGGNHYILKVEARQGGDAKPLKDVRDEIEARLRQEQAQELQEHWLASLRSKAYIKTF
ncbi:MAG TPA: peptidyl-prolyl cis-trans isomerase [Chthoniobacterales bacterium]|jgi:parvulin-like peptidyl-prolyl isomerase